MGGGIVSHFKYMDIVKNGVETQAEVIDGSYSSNGKVNNVSYYSISFEFYDGNGDKQHGNRAPRPPSQFTQGEIEGYFHWGTAFRRLGGCAVFSIIA
jgi:hypothetical protein